MKVASKQISLKPQDLLVLLKIACHRERVFTYAELATELGIAASEAHSCLKRAALSRLVAPREAGGVAIAQTAFREFVLHGAKYCFPAVLGPVVRGVPTSYAAEPLSTLIVQADDLPPVWPSPLGSIRGAALYPLYPTVPAAAVRDAVLYECLALFDALRVGAARERELAQQLLVERI